MAESLDDLWKRFASCDDRAFNALYDRSFYFLNNIARQRLPFNWKAESGGFVDELMTVVWLGKKEKPGYFLSINSLPAWLRNSLIKDLIDFVRKISRRPEAGIDLFDIWGQIFDAEWLKVMNQYLATLPPYDQLIWSEYVQGFAISDITHTDELGNTYSDKKINTRIEKIRAHLKELKRKFDNDEL